MPLRSEIFTAIFSFPLISSTRSNRARAQNDCLHAFFWWIDIFINPYHFLYKWNSAKIDYSCCSLLLAELRPKMITCMSRFWCDRYHLQPHNTICTWNPAEMSLVICSLRVLVSLCPSCGPRRWYLAVLHSRAQAGYFIGVVLGKRWERGAEYTIWATLPIRLDLSQDQHFYAFEISCMHTESEPDQMMPRGIAQGPFNNVEGLLLPDIRGLQQCMWPRWVTCGVKIPSLSKAIVCMLAESCNAVLKRLFQVVRCVQLTHTQQLSLPPPLLCNIPQHHGSSKPVNRGGERSWPIPYWERWWWSQRNAKLSEIIFPR